MEVSVSDEYGMSFADMVCQEYLYSLPTPNEEKDSTTRIDNSIQNDIGPKAHLNEFFSPPPSPIVEESTPRASASSSSQRDRCIGDTLAYVESFEQCLNLEEDTNLAECASICSRYSTASKCCAIAEEDEDQEEFNSPLPPLSEDSDSASLKIRVERPSMQRALTTSVVNSDLLHSGSLNSPKIPMFSLEHSSSSSQVRLEPSSSERKPIRSAKYVMNKRSASFCGFSRKEKFPVRIREARPPSLSMAEPMLSQFTESLPESLQKRLSSPMPMEFFSHKHEQRASTGRIFPVVSGTSSPIPSLAQFNDHMSSSMNSLDESRAKRSSFSSIRSSGGFDMTRS